MTNRWRRPGGALRTGLALLFATWAGACAVRAPHLAESPAPEPVLGDVVDLTPTIVAELARHLLDIASASYTAELTVAELSHRTLWSTLDRLLDGAPGIFVTDIGRSAEGRTLRAVEFGRGPTRVLLWSQMHGDEPTATLALVDLIRFLVEYPEDLFGRRIRDRLTVVVVPMLNPDGAQRRWRQTVTGIDVNRDARRQATPEARALAALHARFSPHFGFNLHDQRPRRMTDGRSVAISLLAPPGDSDGSAAPTFTRAQRLAALMRLVADPLVDGRVTRYDEPYNPHAFGDAMQSWGTSTVLLETGSWDDDRDKSYLRHVNFVMLLAALDAIATGAVERVGVEHYESLPATGPGQDRPGR
jgi:hypothetical protein